MRRARGRISAVFAIHGAVFGTLATRIPWLAEHVHAGSGSLGVALIAPAVGALIAMPMAARLVQRYRSTPVLRTLLIAWCLSLVPPALAPNVTLLFGTLLIHGAAAGMADVAMNAQGVVVEQRYGRSVMSGLHGLWSAGGLAASAAGALAAHADVDGRTHFAVAAAGLSVLAWFACSGLLEARRSGAETPLFARPSRSVLLIGLVAFCAVFVEGGSGDWSAVYLTTVTSAEPGVAATAFTAFALTMTAGRLAGDRVVRRLGPVRTVRTGGLVATAGGVLVLLAPAPPVAVAGFALLGLGVATVVPLGFAAAGRVGANPAAAIAGVATVAYGSGLAAPGIIGGVAQASSLTASFGIVTALCLGMVAGAGALRSPPRVQVGAPD